MKKKILACLTLALSSIGALAVPACPESAAVVQPDGTTLTLRLIGDEFYNYSVTTDGRTVVRNAAGAYVYAELGADGQLTASTVMAHDPAFRQNEEISYLSARQNVYPAATQQQKEMRRQQRQMGIQNPKGLFNYKKFRGLVILVNFTDRKFSYTNAHELFTDMVTKKNYDGFMNNAQIPSKEEYTGSVRDYFYDQSAGLFDPAFDVVGPVDIDVSSTYPRQTSNMAQVVSKVISAADSQVDFSKYDTDGDGMVDMFYIIFAGYGSNFQGNNSMYVWPHAWNVSHLYIRADGVQMGRYACSTEFYGRPSSYYIDGIGTICHEFSHVLGLMDEYDTDYESSGGQSVDPGEWSVMAGGSYLNKARTPVGYSLFQRYQSGFAVPEVIKGSGEYALYDIDTCNTGYRINIPDEPKEYFLLENRRKTGTKWNCYGPGQGMLVFRVDSTNTAVWTANDINVNPAHNYYELVRAKYNGSGDSASDPFPGTGNVKQLVFGGTPDFKSWAGLSPQFGLDSIWENNGVVHFRIQPDNTNTKIEDFEEMITEGKFDQGVKGTFTKWNFNNAWVTKENATNNVLAMMNKATCETAEIPHGWILNCSFRCINTTSESIYFRLQAKVNGAYQTMTSTAGTSTVSVGANKTSTVSFKIPKLENSSLMLTVTAGAKTNPVYIDDFRITKDYPMSVDGIAADSFQTPLLAISTGEEIRVTTLPGTEVSFYDLQGRLLTRAATDASGTAVFRPQARGCYIASAAGKAIKILF